MKLMTMVKVNTDDIINFILVFLLGFGIAASDDHGTSEVVRKGRWFNLTRSCQWSIYRPPYFQISKSHFVALFKTQGQE